MTIWLAIFTGASLLNHIFPSTKLKSARPCLREPNLVYTPTNIMLVENRYIFILQTHLNKYCPNIKYLDLSLGLIEVLKHEVEDEVQREF